MNSKGTLICDASSEPVSDQARLQTENGTSIMGERDKASVAALLMRLQLRSLLSFFPACATTAPSLCTNEHASDILHLLCSAGSGVTLAPNSVLDPSAVDVPELLLRESCLRRNRATLPGAAAAMPVVRELVSVLYVQRVGVCVQSQ